MKNFKGIISLVAIIAISNVCNAAQPKATAAIQLELAKALDVQKGIINKVSNLAKGQEPSAADIEKYNKQQDFINKNTDATTQEGIINPWEKALTKPQIKARELIIQRIRLLPAELAAGRLPIQTTEPDITLPGISKKKIIAEETTTQTLTLQPRTLKQSTTIEPDVTLPGVPKKVGYPDVKISNTTFKMPLLDINSNFGKFVKKSEDPKDNNYFYKNVAETIEPSWIKPAREALIKDSITNEDEILIQIIETVEYLIARELSKKTLDFKYAIGKVNESSKIATNMLNKLAGQPITITTETITQDLPMPTKKPTPASTQTTTPAAPVTIPTWSTVQLGKARQEQPALSVFINLQATQSFRDMVDKYKNAQTLFAQNQTNLNPVFLQEVIAMHPQATAAHLFLLLAKNIDDIKDAENNKQDILNNLFLDLKHLKA